MILLRASAVRPDAQVHEATAVIELSGLAQDGDGSVEQRHHVLVPGTHAVRRHRPGAGARERVTRQASGGPLQSEP